MDSVLELRAVTKEFPGHRAVDDVSLSLGRGELFSLLGPSGCGKTTVLRMVAGFETPTRGDVLLNGRVIQHLRPYERPVSTVFQSYALFPHMTVRANIEFGLRRKKLGDIDRRVREVVELVRLQGKETRYPPELSGGEKQRTALARSLVVAPEVLLLDEPLSALDPSLREQVRGELKALQRRVGITFLLVTHDQEEALAMSDRIALMRRGRIEQTGTPEQIYLKPRTRFVADFFGAVNWIDNAGVRPEATRLSRAPRAGGRRATVRSSTFLGDVTRVEVALESGVTARADVPRTDGAYRSGEAVEVWWDAADEIHAAGDAA
ncbi:MAG: ABC transporter ATP-binding protein [Bryobacteraceae bacterium]